MRLIAAVAVFVVLVAAVARAGPPAECGPPAAMSDDWPVSPPAQQGLDPELICATGPNLAKRTEAAPHGVVVVRHGALVYEQYFAGADMYGNVVPYGANALHDIRPSPRASSHCWSASPSTVVGSAISMPR